MNEFDQVNKFIPVPRKEIINMQSYSAPLENRRNLLRLDFNENTLGPSQRVYEAIKEINLDEISIYPEYNLLKEFLCNHYHYSRKFNPEEIGLFNGADAAINAIFNAFGSRDEIFLTTNPTFGYYSPCSEMQGMKKIVCSYEGENFFFPIKKFEEKIIKYNPKLVFICNPNNPTGTVLNAQQIIDFAKLNQKSLIVIDELYEKFNGDSLLPLIDFEKIKNIVIIQSLSKTAGLAGLRMGFAFGNKKIIEYINKVTGPYDVNSFAVTATLAALNDKTYIDNYVSEVKKAREWIEKKFKSVKIRNHFSGGNYFLIWPNKNPLVLIEEMREKGILIRSMKNKKDIENSIRVSIGTQEQMKFFWNTYKELDFNC